MSCTLTQAVEKLPEHWTLPIIKDRVRDREQNVSMCVLGMIADHPTPKFLAQDGTAYTVNSRDYKGVMVVVLSGCDRPFNGKQSSRELLRSGRIQRNAGDGEWNSQCKL